MRPAASAGASPAPAPASAPAEPAAEPAQPPAEPAAEPAQPPAETPAEPADETSEPREPRARSHFLSEVLPRILLALRGLRFRLVVAFALVAVVSALSTGALAFREARTGVLQQSQDAVIKEFRDSVDNAAPATSSPSDQTDLQLLVDTVATSSQAQGWRVLATYGGRRATSLPDDRFDELTPELRRQVATQPAAVFQRVNRGGRPVLVVGLPVTYRPTDTGFTLSGLSVYLVVPQNTEQAYVRAMITAIEHATLSALCVAVLLALLAASGVLRPVRALRRATRRMAEGHLDIRLAVNGSDELADLSRSFNDTAAALEQSVTELRRLEAQARRFVADVSHELRTPLAAMSAVTDVLDDEAAHLDRVTADAVRLISGETVRLSRLVNDLMEISRFDAGAAELNLDEIDLAESVRRTLASRGWQQQVETRLPAPGALRTRVDPRRLDVVVANLVGNALRHGAPPVVVSAGVREERPRGAWVVIEVADSGPGITEADMPHIFERFYKADTTRTRSESSGLGLAITAENVTLHGGRIRARNRPGGGSVFTVEFPLRHSAEGAGGSS
ncbi:two-component system, OmpR family, sensor histidine kinase MtrB [Streptomyces sp. DvalAA-14]|uniref:sensor histidine kinase n=1 Tax=unclassified Streptomyces TaxID=2593676 RepID=UPI00081B1B89|nr:MULTISPECIES: HAMP domain-containing sensor histidine kinase [unclassified Streptomyces]MYS24697.1 HAMP domain-containing protein [Streptomyces sp. SID4948]SCE48535.1 two-component system, OmpR family, sensor histidine kinase MtrB [Streptomyces sp. DvalAA-14]